MANSLLTYDKPSLSPRAGSPGRCPRTGLSQPRDHLESPHLLPVRSRRPPPLSGRPDPPARGRALPPLAPGRGSRPAGARWAPAVPAHLQPEPRCPARGLSAVPGRRSRHRLRHLDAPLRRSRPAAAGARRPPPGAVPVEDAAGSWRPASARPRCPLTVRPSHDVLQERVLRRHQPSPSPGHSRWAGAQRGAEAPLRAAPSRALPRRRPPAPRASCPRRDRHQRLCGTAAASRAPQPRAAAAGPPRSDPRRPPPRRNAGAAAPSSGAAPRRGLPAPRALGPTAADGAFRRPLPPLGGGGRRARPLAGEKRGVLKDRSQTPGSRSLGGGRHRSVPPRKAPEPLLAALIPGPAPRLPTMISVRRPLSSKWSNWLTAPWKQRDKLFKYNLWQVLNILRYLTDTKFSFRDWLCCYPIPIYQ